jgi:hypothetical protein
MNLRGILMGYNQNPIAYYPIYRSVTGSTTAAIALSQLLFWHTAVKCRKFYKTDAEIREETRLTENEWRTAKKIIKGLDFVSIEVKGVPARTYYDFDYLLLAEAVGKAAESEIQSSYVESTKLGQLNPRNKDGGIHTTITENTTENTTEIEGDGENLKSLEEKEIKAGVSDLDQERERYEMQLYQLLNKKCHREVTKAVTEIGTVSREEFESSLFTFLWESDKTIGDSKGAVNGLKKLIGIHADYVKKNGVKTSATDDRVEKVMDYVKKEWVNQYGKGYSDGRDAAWLDKETEYLRRLIRHDAEGTGDIAWYYANNQRSDFTFKWGHFFDGLTFLESEFNKHKGYAKARM